MVQKGQENHINLIQAELDQMLLFQNGEENILLVNKDGRG